MAKKRRRNQKHNQAPVSLGGVCHEEGLPFPVVHYPNHYGAFFAFSETSKGDVFLCSCNRSALENLIQLNARAVSPNNSNPLREAPVDSFNAPDILAKISMKLGEASVYDNFRFKEKLCHRCNLIPPTQRFCHEMYGGRFRQHFGWYIQQAYLRLGISTTDFIYLDEACPDEYKSLLDKINRANEAYSKELARLNEIVNGPDQEDISPNEVTYWHNVREEDAEEMNRLRKEHQSLCRNLKNSVENIVRQEFGFRKIG